MGTLYHILIDVYTKILDKDIHDVKELKKLNDVYSSQYKNIMRLLTDENTSRSSIINYVSESTSFVTEQNRQADELHANIRRHHSNKAIITEYQQRMNFVKKFNENRAEDGQTMSWELCLQEGREKLQWCYKNANSLRAEITQGENINLVCHTYS